MRTQKHSELTHRLLDGLCIDVTARFWMNHLRAHAMYYMILKPGNWPLPGGSTRHHLLTILRIEPCSTPVGGSSSACCENKGKGIVSVLALCFEDVSKACVQSSGQHCDAHWKAWAWCLSHSLLLNACCQESSIFICCRCRRTLAFPSVAPTASRMPFSTVFKSSSLGHQSGNEPV